MQNANLSELLEAGAHFGHKKELSHPQAKKYIFTIQNGINIINLEKTSECLKRASDFLRELTLSGKIIIFVGTKKQAKQPIEKTAKDCSMPYVTSRWLGGTLTNFDTIKKRIESYKKLKADLENKENKECTKKEKVRLEKELAKLDNFFLGLKDLQKLPDALFIIDPVEEHVAKEEAQKMGIPIVALCNTNVDFSKIDYPIPGNDNAPKTVNYICEYLAKIIKENKK